MVKGTTQFAVVVLVASPDVAFVLKQKNDYTQLKMRKPANLQKEKLIEP